MGANNGSQAASAIFGLKNVAPDEWREVRYQNIETNVNVKVLSTAELQAIAAGRPAPMIDVTPDAARTQHKRK